MFEVCQISNEQALQIILERKPLGLFFCRENQRYVAIDNSFGDAFVEEFDNAVLCKDWLNGKFEVVGNDGDTCYGFTEWLCRLSQVPVAGLADICINAIDEWSLYYLAPNAVQQIKNAIADTVPESPYALADCIFQAAIDNGKGTFTASCLTMEVVDDVMKNVSKG